MKDFDCEMKTSLKVTGDDGEMEVWMFVKKEKNIPKPQTNRQTTQ